MLPKKGNKLPKKGNKLHRGRRGPGIDGEFEKAIAAALTGELGLTHRAIKTVMRWTGASERTVKHWFAGTHGPSGQSLIALARHSDAVLTYFLVAANRSSLSAGIQLIRIRTKLQELVETIDACNGGY
jgi:hypothetical protein